MTFATMSVNTNATPAAPRNTRSSAMPSVARRSCSQRVVGVASEADSKWKNGMTDTSPTTVVAAMTSASPRSARQRRRSCGGSNTQKARTVFMSFAQAPGRGAAASYGSACFEHVVIAHARTARPLEQCALHARQQGIHTRRPLEPARGITRRQHHAERPRHTHDEVRIEEARATARRGVVDSQTAPLASGAAESAKRATTVAAQQIPTHFPGHEAAHDHPDERRIRCEPWRQYACERREVRRTVHGAEI